MRILSQDGNIDINYDLVAFVSCYKCKDGNGWFEIDMYSGALSAKNVRMAKYSTEEKARKAMEMLHEVYVTHTQFKIMTEVQRSVFLSNVSEKEQDNLYGLFRFPTDDEVEV